MTETLRERGRQRHLCGCGRPHEMRVMVQVRQKASAGSGGVIYTMHRSLCEECATRLVDHVETEFPRKEGSS
jgi:hypothetical protein